METRYPDQSPTNLGDQPNRSLKGDPIEVRAKLCMDSPTQELLALKGFKPETHIGAHS